jgi:hypothetical protein
MKLDFKKPVQTRCGFNVRIYHIYKYYIHGAYEFEDDEWKVAAWSFPHGFNTSVLRGGHLDLVNVD